MIKQGSHMLQTLPRCCNLGSYFKLTPFVYLPRSIKKLRIRCASRLSRASRKLLMGWRGWIKEYGGNKEKKSDFNEWVSLHSQVEPRHSRLAIKGPVKTRLIFLCLYICQDIMRYRVIYFQCLCYLALPLCIVSMHLTRCAL